MTLWRALRGGHLDGKGNGELLTMVVRQLLRSAKFVDGFNGEGWQLWIDEVVFPILLLTN